MTTRIKTSILIAVISIQWDYADNIWLHGYLVFVSIFSKLYCCNEYYFASKKKTTRIMQYKDSLKSCACAYYHLKEVLFLALFVPLLLFWRKLWMMRQDSPLLYHVDSCCYAICFTLYRSSYLIQPVTHSRTFIRAERCNPSRNLTF